MKRSLLPKINVLSVHHQSWVCKEVLRPFSFHFTCFTSHCIWIWLPSALPVTITSGPSAPMPDKNRNNGIPWQWCPQSPWPQLTSKTDQQNIRSSPGKSKLIFLSFTLLLGLLLGYDSGWESTFHSGLEAGISLSAIFSLSHFFTTKLTKLIKKDNNTRGYSQITFALGGRGGVWLI